MENDALWSGKQRIQETKNIFPHLIIANNS